MGLKIRWGVLGTAGIARSQVVPAIRVSGNGVVAAIAGRDAERTRTFASEFGIARSHPSYEALLSDPDIDAVYIPLPNSLHADWSIRAARAGKAVLCEKPLALDGHEAQLVVDTFSQARLPLMEGFMYRFHPQNVFARKLVADGAIGELREVRAHLSVDIMEAAASGNVRFDSMLGGGSLLDMGCYAVSVARGLFGSEPLAALASFDVDPASGVDLAAAAVLDFGKGRNALVSSSFRAGGQGAYQLIGTTGTIEVPRAIIPGMGTRLGETLVIVMDADGRRTETHFEPVDHYRLMVEAFADAVLTGKPVPYPPQDAVGNLRALDAIAASARSAMRMEI